MEDDFNALSPGFSGLLAELVEDVCMTRGNSVEPTSDLSNHFTCTSDANHNHPPARTNHVFTTSLAPAAVPTQCPPQAAVNPMASPLTHPTADLSTSWIALVQDSANGSAGNPRQCAAGDLVGFHAGAGDLGSSEAYGKRGRKPKPRLPDLQQQLDRLIAQFQHLSQENGFLRNKLKALERVVPNRESHVGFLTTVQAMQITESSSGEIRAGTEAAAAPPPQAAVAQVPTAVAAAAIAAAAAAPSDSSRYTSRSNSGMFSLGLVPTAAQLPSTLGTQRIPSTGATSKSSDLATSAAACSSCAPVQSSTHPVSEPLSHASLPPADHAAVGGAAAAAATGAAGGVRPGAPGPGPSVTVPLSPVLAPGWPESSPSSGVLGSWARPVHPPGTPTIIALCPSPDGTVPDITLAAVEELKKTTAADFRLLYKLCVLQLGVLVASAETFGPTSPQHDRMASFIKNFLEYMDRVWLLAPGCFPENMYVNLETGQPEPPGEDFWSAVGSMANLSKQQAEEVTSLATVHTRNVGPVLQERVRLASELSARIAAAEQAKKSGDSLQLLDAVEELTEQLRRNVVKEYQAHWDIGDFLCYSVLTPLQIGKILVASYPYLPDGVAIMHATGNKKARASSTGQAAAMGAPR